MQDTLNYIYFIVVGNLAFNGKHDGYGVDVIQS